MTEDEEHEVSEKGAMLHRIQGQTESDLVQRIVKNSVLFRKPYAPGDQSPVGSARTGKVEVATGDDEVKEANYLILVREEEFELEEDEQTAVILGQKDLDTRSRED